MTAIEKLKTKYSFDTDKFEKDKQDYYKFRSNINNPSFSVEKSKAAYNSLCENFDTIFEVCVAEAKLKESVVLISPEQRNAIPKVGIATEITGLAFTIGLFRDFYIVAPLSNSRNIKFMKDDFWELLFELSSIGKFGFAENEKPDKNMRNKHPQLFNKTGNYYKLLRNYFLFETEYGLVRELGYFSVSWGGDTKYDLLIPKICQAFKIMYQINFLLWRHENKNVKF